MRCFFGFFIFFGAAVLSFAEEATVRYTTGRPNPLPIPTCEFHAVNKPRPYDFKLPVQVKIYKFDWNSYKQGTALEKLAHGELVFEGKVEKPINLKEGYYVAEVEGQKTPIYFTYDLNEIWQFYQIYRMPENMYMGPFVAPSYSRLQAGQYEIFGFHFRHKVDCRNDETAVFDVPSYDGLPPFMAPTKGYAW